MTRVVAFVGDLLDRSKVDAAIPGVEFGRDPTAGAGADIVVVDVARYADDIAAIREAAPAARMVAYGRHDNPAGLARARADGADEALPRSRFFADPAAAVASASSPEGRN